MKIINGRFIEGENVTVEVNGGTYTRKVRFSKDAGDLFVMIKNNKYFYSEFE